MAKYLYLIWNLSPMNRYRRTLHKYKLIYLNFTLKYYAEDENSIYCFINKFLPLE